MKSIRLLVLCFATLIWLVITDGCAGPVYLNKELNSQPTEHVVFVVPSSLFGDFITTKVESNKNQKNIYTQKIPFNDWEMFDVKFNHCLRTSFMQKNVEVFVLENEQVPTEVKTMIANDTIKNNYLQYLTLNDLDKIQKIQNGIFIVFTKFELTRIFPRITVSTKYYVYKIQGKQMILANKMEKTYEMTGIGWNTIGEALLDSNPEDKLSDRWNGLHEDEKDSYINICSLHADKIVAEIIKYCFKK